MPVPSSHIGILYDRNRIVQSLAEENTLSDDDESPTAGMGDDEKHQQPWAHPPMSGEASGT